MLLEERFQSFKFCFLFAAACFKFSVRLLSLVPKARQSFPNRDEFLAKALFSFRSLCLSCGLTPPVPLSFSLLKCRLELFALACGRTVKMRKPLLRIVVNLERALRLFL